ncbi:uncharacterized protein LOC129601642 [Paramacrobiotus metropolitanus]|uniref:uncharacterized protein LOC129601642 n=1 Tax=Paramacrobiotus metropolitanus TaxID=2943436 RepID=UPI002445D02C|nr:uncharacterized protein LOC129601642 [Paramacrobiotus metropolitanus]
MFRAVLGLLWCLQIAPQHCAASVDLSSAFINVPYKNFQVRIYKDTGDLAANGSYYYAPAGLFVPNSTYIVHNELQSYVAFSVKLWDIYYGEHIQSQLSQQGRQLSPSNVRIIPFHSMRVDVIENTLPIKVMNQWTPIPHQPAFVLVRILCATDPECTSVQNAVENSQDQLLFGLELTFALKKPVDTKRNISIKAAALQSSDTFRAIQQKFYRMPVVCLQYTDLRRLAREALDTLLEEAIPDEDFVSENELYKATNSVVRLLKPNVRSTTEFTEQSWKGVFWPVGSIRPDEMIKNLNESLGNGNNWIKAYFQSGNNSTALESTSSMDWSGIRSQLKDSKAFILWNGDRFIIRPMTLHCINLTALNSDGAIGQIKVWSSSKAGDLSSAVNVPFSGNRESTVMDIERLKSTVDDVARQLYNLSTALENTTPIGSIIAYHCDASLPPCWLLCDGAPFDNGTYPLLATALFPRVNTPDLLERFPMGISQKGNYSYVGQRGGEAEHVLTINEIPSHSHEIRSWPDSGYNYVYGDNKLKSGIITDRDVDGSGGKRMNTTTTGGGQAHNNLPPFLTTRFIIRAC